MSYHIPQFLILFVLLCSASAQTVADSNEILNLTHDPANDVWSLSWWGFSGRTYFIQQSNDLTNWQYVPVIETGHDEVIDWGFFTEADKLFMRLKSVDRVTEDPFGDDFDGDTISNWDELLQQSDLFKNEDLNENSIPDDWEFFWNDQFAVFPERITAALTYRQSRVQQLHLNNPVSPDADFTITLNNNAVDSQVIYSYEDSLTGDVVYNWTEISTTGTLLSNISSSDDAFEPIALTQFSFPFYGVNHTAVFISSNGLITFESGDDSFWNTKIPSKQNPNDFIAPFWSDQFPSIASGIYYKEESDHIIIQFDGVAAGDGADGAGLLTYQTVLHSDGLIEFFYKEMTDNAQLATVGVENSSGTNGLEIAYDERYVQDGLAVRISSDPTYFVEISSLTGTTTTGNTSTVNVTFNTFDLAPGVYTAGMEITHTGTGATVWNIPLVLEITNSPATIRLLQPIDEQVYWQDERVRFSANAHDTDFGIDRVEFYASQVLRDQDIEGQSDEFHGTWSDLDAGQHTIVARAVDPFGATVDSEAITITILADSDLDRMDDAWEQQHFGSLDEEASADFDGDGMPNIFEYNHRTNPNDTESKLMFTETQTGDFNYFLVDQTLLAETKFKKKTISAAIYSANDFDVIEVRPGTYNEALANTSARLYVFGPAGARSTIIDASGLNTRVLYLGKESVFSGLTFQGGRFEPSSSPYLIRGGAGLFLSISISSNWNNPRFIGCRFIDNSSTLQGSAIYVWHGSPTFISCTIAGNGNNKSSGSAIYNESGGDRHTIRLINTLLWNPDVSGEIGGRTSSITFDHSLVRNRFSGSVLIDNVDQGTTDPGLAYDYSLTEISVARNAGTLSFYAATDLDGEALVDGLKDIGADEFNDEDNDGLPNWIERLAGMDLSIEADQDNDFLNNLDDYNAGANPFNSDTDSDGLLDGDELSTDGTSGDTDGHVTGVNNPDTDEDNLDDGWEVRYGLNPTVANAPEIDSDGDGLADILEFKSNSNPLLGDTDNDSIPDLYEYNNDLDLASDDTELDKDNDGLSNLYEYQAGMLANNLDSDGDLLEDSWEIKYGLNPIVANAPEVDSDGDGLADILEFKSNSNPLIRDTDNDSIPDLYEYNNNLDLVSDDTELDKDNDGLSNLLEYQIGTQANSFDSDGDLLSDSWEIEYSLNPLIKNDVNTDEDNDGVDLFAEYLNKTDPANPDSDNDSVEDSTEITQGSNPNDSNDNGQPPGSGILESVIFTVGDPSGSNSERWEMAIQGLGPDTRVLRVASRNFGEMSNPAAYQLWKNSDYRITLLHLGTDRSDDSDYDWEALIGGSSETMLPTTPVLDNASTHTASSGNRFFGVGSWIVDNEDGLLGEVDEDFGEVNFAEGKKALLLKVNVVTINSFIRQNNVNNPFNLIPGVADTVFQGDNRGFDENGTYRTQQKFSVVTQQAADANGLLDNAYTDDSDGRHESRNATGITREYDKASSLDSSENLTQAARDDTVLNDGFLKIDQGQAGIENMDVATTRLSDGKVKIECFGSAADPLISNAPSLDYEFTIVIDRSNPSAPTYSLTGDHDGFPDYEVYINHQRVFEFDAVARGQTSLSLPAPKEFDVTDTKPNNKDQPLP